MSNMRSWIEERFPLKELTEKHFTKYPAPKNLNFMWNFGLLLAFFLGIQIITGIFLAMYYKPQADAAFNSIIFINTQVNFGWLMRSLHQVGASFFFILLYLHTARGIYYGSYKQPRELVWMIGLLLLMFSMLQSTTGYILPWGQLSYWAATVVTNFLGAVPFVGETLVIWLRGDFSIGESTLGRFFSLHTTLIPIGLIGATVLLHISALHKVGSNNPDGIDIEKGGDQTVPFHPYFTVKDVFFGSFVIALFFYFVFFQPDFFNEPINSEPANPFQTPADIVPEWYFSPWFAIIKAIPNKFLGLLALSGGIVILFFLPYLDRSPVRSSRYRPLKRILTFLFFANFVLLGYLGFLQAVGTPLLVSRISTALYFLYFVALVFIPRIEKTRPLPERLT